MHIHAATHILTNPQTHTPTLTNLAKISGCLTALSYATWATFHLTKSYFSHREKLFVALDADADAEAGAGRQWWEISH